MKYACEFILMLPQKEISAGCLQHASVGNVARSSIKHTSNNYVRYYCHQRCTYTPANLSGYSPKEKSPPREALIFLPSSVGIPYRHCKVLLCPRGSSSKKSGFCRRSARLWTCTNMNVMQKPFDVNTIAQTSDANEALLAKNLAPVLGLTHATPLPFCVCVLLLLSPRVCKRERQGLCLSLTTQTQTQAQALCSLSGN